MPPAVSLANEIAVGGISAREVTVEITYEVVKLFSDQLYASPVKAVEELVVNSWDSGANVCSVLVDLDGPRPIIAVYDDGKGMTLDELENLWHIGVSNKLESAATRRQIGKFGIGKLASYAVGRRVTYVSRAADTIHAVTIDFEDFAKATNKSTGKSTPVTLTLRMMDSIAALRNVDGFEAASSVLATMPDAQNIEEASSWTIVVIEDLKPKAKQLAVGRLNWVLSTAMPFASDFKLWLNGKLVSSSKEKLEKLVEFSVNELDASRITDLGAITGEQWTISGEKLVSESFPNGISGQAFVTKQSLYAEGGKSEDLGRSHGFFVRVHNRLINESDPLLGARPLSFETWYRFAVIVEVPDLNPFVTASRDDVEHSELKRKLREVLIQLFNQCREAYNQLQRESENKNRQKKEGVRDYVSVDLVERPLADAYVAQVRDIASDGISGNLSWRYLEPIDDVAQLRDLVEKLYISERRDRKYSFIYSPAGAGSPLARLDAVAGKFIVNEDHELVREFFAKAESKRLLEAFIVGEALLEVYLRAAEIAPEIILDLLERRDQLLRSLARDESYSLHALSQSLLDASDDDKDLEVALVGALRALGFTTRHIGASGTPDGLAEYVIHGLEEKSFTLEAKSSKSTPSLPQLDFAGLRSHYEALSANGCILVAPTYPGSTDMESEVSRRSMHQKVSCWTIEQLASVVESAEKRHVHARTLQEIVLNCFTPLDVTAAVTKLLSEPSYDKHELYAAIIIALSDLSGRLKKTPRTVDHIAGEISRIEQFNGVDTPEIRDAIIDLARSSSGYLHLNDSSDVVTVLGSLEELERRLASFTGSETAPRKRGTFRS